MLEQQNTPVTLEETAIQELVSHLRGTLLRPGDAGYEQARQVYNGMIDKHPALIARCVDVADVIAAVNFAREHELTLAVRGGGHSGPGLCTCDDGLMVDLSDMKGIRVDPAARTRATSKFRRSTGSSTCGTGMTLALAQCFACARPPAKKPLKPCIARLMGCWPMRSSKSRKAHRAQAASSFPLATKGVCNGQALRCRVHPHLPSGQWEGYGTPGHP